MKRRNFILATAGGICGSLFGVKRTPAAKSEGVFYVVVARHWDRSKGLSSIDSRLASGGPSLAVPGMQVGVVENIPEGTHDWHIVAVVTVQKFAIEVMEVYFGEYTREWTYDDQPQPHTRSVGE